MLLAPSPDIVGVENPSGLTATLSGSVIRGLETLENGRVLEIPESVTQVFLQLVLTVLGPAAMDDVGVQR